MADADASEIVVIPVDFPKRVFESLEQCLHL
jgi:hypothetical protein